MLESFNIHAIIRKRSDQPGFHMAAEQHVRIEFWNMKTRQANAQFTYDGDIVLTCYAGEFELEVDKNTAKLVEMDQVVIPHGSATKLTCVSSGTVQLIWAPPYARATQDR